jgi:hypothetical protein
MPRLQFDLSFFQVKPPIGETEIGIIQSQERC